MTKRKARSERASVPPTTGGTRLGRWRWVTGDGAGENGGWRDGIVVNNWKREGETSEMHGLRVRVGAVLVFEKTETG